MHIQANGVGEVGVERHARRQCDGVIGVKPHDERGYRGGDAGGKHNSIRRHSRLRQNLRVHHHDVGHGDERRQTAEQFLFYGRLVLSQPEVTVDE